MMAEKELIFTRSASGLVRELSWWDVLIMLIATPAASGILYYSVSTASSYPGASVPLAFFIGMIMFLPICASIAIVSSIMPRSGSLYILISRLINPTLGYLAGFLFFLGYSLTIGVLGYIIMGIIGGILTNSGMASNITGFTNLGIALQSRLWGTIGGILWVAFFWLITLAGVRPFRNILRILFAIPGIATVITIIYFFFTSPSMAQLAFNYNWGSGAFQSILNAAKTNGWTAPSFSWSATIGVLLVVIWAYGGIEMASYASGEVKTPRRSMIKGFMWGWLGVGLLYIILAFAVYRPFGGFIGAYDFLYRNHPEVLKEIMPLVSPSVPFYISSIIKNTWIGVIIASAIALWFVNTMPPFFLGISRLIFAMAMDRAIPERLANVNPKNGAPTWATHLTAIVAVIGVILNMANVKVVLGTITFAVFFPLWLYGLGAMLLPYRRPDIYETSPIKTKIGEVPIVTIFGFLTFGIGWFIILFCAREISTPIAIALAVAVVVGMILYFVQQGRNIKRGIDISKIYSQIPPE